MELKTNYQYSYFIHPFVIKEQSYKKYLMKLINDERCKFKILKQESDIELYNYFTKEVRETLFGTFGFSEQKIKTLEKAPVETRAALIAKYPCSIFEFSLKQDIQGTTENENGIFFKIQKFEVICFNTGICFLALKTTIENSEKFSDLLNFNYKFRDINSDGNNYNSYDNIRLQTDSFSDVSKLTEFIKDITGTNVDRLNFDLGNDRFLTYSYACIDQREWCQDTDFRVLKYSFLKYANVLSADCISKYEENSDESIDVLSKWKFAKIAVTKQGVTFFSSTADMTNYCVLPVAYENEYLYTYIYTLYKKLYIKKISRDLESPVASKVKQARKEFADFTKTIWTQELSQDETGALLETKMKSALKIEELYSRLKSSYDTIYKEMRIEKNAKVTIGIAVLLGISFVFNILSYIAVIK